MGTGVEKIETSSLKNGEQSSVNSLPSKRQVFTDLPTAMRSILKTYDPKVVSFGEVHPSPLINEVKTTSIRFCEILPLLNDMGYSKGVIEGMIDDQAVYEDLERLKENTDDYSKSEQNVCRLIYDSSYAPAIYENLQGYKTPEDLAYVFIYSSKQKNISLYGALTKEISERYCESCKDKLSEYEIRKAIVDGMETRVFSLIKEGDNTDVKVFTYSGAMHNDIDPKNNEMSFGDELSESLGDKYLEIDIVVPEYAMQNKIFWLRSYGLNAPKSGVEVVPDPMNPQHIYLIFARSQN